MSHAYYDRKYGNTPPGTRVDLRYAAIRADLKLPTRANTMPSRTPSARPRCISCSRTCGSAACGCRVRGAIFQASSRSPERHRHAVGAPLSRMAHRGFCGLSIEDKNPDHSAFSRARNELCDKDIFRHVFERGVEECIAAGR